MAHLPDRPSLEHLRKQAKRRRRDRGIALARAQREVAAEYGFASWTRLVRHVLAASLAGVERAVALADWNSLRTLLVADPSAATADVCGLPPLIALLRDSCGTPGDVRQCAELLLQAGADPSSTIPSEDGEWAVTASYLAVEREDLTLLLRLIDAGAEPDDDAFYHACERGGSAFLEVLYQPGFEEMINHKLDFEDEEGLRWFLDLDPDLDALGCLHWAIGRGRGVAILQLLLDHGADPDLPHAQGGFRPLEAAARAGHLAAYDLLAGLGAAGEPDAVGAAVLAVARGESVVLPDEPPPMPGIPGHDYSWVLGQLALLGRTEVVRSLIAAGLPVDSRGWSNFTPLEQAAMHGRAETVRLLVDLGADVEDCAFDEEGPTPLDAAVWGWRNNRAADGDYEGTVAALVSAGSPTRHRPPTGNARIDALLRAQLDVVIDDQPR